MFENTLYRLERSQKTTLTVLGFCFLFVSAIWFASEIQGWNLPLEPLVVFIGGVATLFASFWPFKSDSKFAGTFGRVKFDYTTNNGEFEIGGGHLKFTLKFSKSSD